MNKYEYNVELFQAPGAITYYLLGAFISDGGIDPNLRRISITSKDFAWLETISKAMSFSKPLYKRKSANCYDLVINSKFITSWFINNGCIPKKSLTVRLPKNIPKDYMSHFIRGVFDGDGSISITKYGKVATAIRCYIISASIDLVAELCDFFKEINLRFKLVKIINKNKSIMGRPKKDYHDAYRICFNNSHAVSFLNYIYQDKNLFLDRKFNKFVEYCAIREVEVKTLRIRDKFNSKQEILNLLETKTISQIARIYGTTKKTIYNRLKNMNIMDEALSILKRSREFRKMSSPVI